MNPALLSILFPISELSGLKVNYDVAFPLPIVILSLVVILAVGGGIIFLIVLAVKFLLRLRKNRNPG